MLGIYVVGPIELLKGPDVVNPMEVFWGVSVVIGPNVVDPMKVFWDVTVFEGGDVVEPTVLGCDEIMDVVVTLEEVIGEMADEVISRTLDVSVLELLAVILESIEVVTGSVFIGGETDVV